jgi:peptidoglycan/xylan/chitin deacetylase (PgdA/CDA1 family)
MNMIALALKDVTLRRILQCACVTGLLLFTTGAEADVGAKVRELIENQRRILILREAANQGERAEARRAGQYLFFRNQQLGRRLVDEISHSAQELPARYQEMTRVLDEPVYVDEDRLILRSALEALLPKLPPNERRDASQRLKRLADLRKMLGGNFESVFLHVPLRPGTSRDGRWAAYIGRIAQATTARQLLEELDQELVAASEPITVPTEAAARARVLEWNGEELPEQTVLLTFDDGPHLSHTAEILDILKKESVHAVFFQVGRNLGEVSQGAAMPGHAQQIVSRLLLEGHAVGNHSFTHPVLPRLDRQTIAREIEDTQALIDAMVPEGSGRTGGFRPPYGARDDKVLAEIDQHHLRSVVWNIDSEDWADPLPESIAHRVVQEAEKAGRGIVLMHDIHARSVEALPIVIRELRKRGFQFARWNGQKIVVDSVSGTDVQSD